MESTCGRQRGMIFVVSCFCLGKRDEVAAVPSAGPEESGRASDLSCGSCRGEAAP